MYKWLLYIVGVAGSNHHYKMYEYNIEIRFDERKKSLKSTMAENEIEILQFWICNSVVAQ